MCGATIIADLLQWGSGAAADLANGKRKNPGSYHSKPLRSKPVIDIEDDFEAEFQDFKDHSYDEVEIDVKPFAFSASENSGPRDFGWGENCAKTPEISSVLSAVEDNETQFVEDASPAKKLKSDSGDLLPAAENTEVPSFKS